MLMLPPRMIGAVYPCTYRELSASGFSTGEEDGISLYLQGTPINCEALILSLRYIPVPTGNSKCLYRTTCKSAVYPCTYRELRLIAVFLRLKFGISLYLQGTQRRI